MKFMEAKQESNIQNLRYCHFIRHLAVSNKIKPSLMNNHTSHSSVYPKKLRIWVHMETSTWMFAPAFIVIAKTIKEDVLQQASRETKLQQIQTVEWHLPLERKEQSSLRDMQ